MRKLLLLLGFIAAAYFAQAQNMDQNLAIQFYQNEEYAKAADLFAKLYDKNPSDSNYHYLYNTYIQLKEYDKLEKILKKRILMGNHYKVRILRKKLIIFFRVKMY